MDLPAFVCAFFAAKNVHLLTAFLCWRSVEVVGVWRECAARGVRMRAAGCCWPLPLPAVGARREGVLLDVHCPHAKVLLDKASVAHAFNHRYSWLLLDTAAAEANGSVDYKVESRSQAMLRFAAVLPDADVVWATPAAAMDVYRVAVGWPLVNTALPSPSAAMWAAWSALPAAAARRRDLAGVRLSAATVVSRPQQFSGWADVSSRAVDTFPKLTYPLMMLLAEDLNFRYDLRQVDAYGEELNGTFGGLAGLLQRGIDIGVASMFMRADRWRALHYAAETIELKGAFIFRQPAQSAVANVFALPFSRGVWAAAGCAACAAGALLAALAALARIAGAPEPALVHITLPDCFTFVMGAICQQGAH
ncbi:Glutamate receptor delta-1 subunit [Papilio xuthus]|uniref:Glutamate receptor delta-1 subunit n=1 Tax=Papilio xuthus TaxID=66420 RepID=A0A194PUB1_PAPXU|nr:Glutamate receptor delta-1 subunit [Papilio xuthus]